MNTIIGHYYDVNEDSVNLYLSIPQTVGYPRGRKRTEKVLNN